MMRAGGVLSPDDAAELVEYINDETTVLHAYSPEPTYGDSDPEESVIRLLTRVRRMRVIRRALSVLEDAHVMTLKRAFTRSKTRQMALMKLFDLKAGVAVHMVDDMPEFLAACTAYLNGAPSDRQRGLVDRLLDESKVALEVACKRYETALRASERVHYRDKPRAALPPVAHVCRASSVYGCPCQRQEEAAWLS